jgi:hypothetical protein
MASSVSSERAFSSAGITISKRRNRLKPDVVEALQFLKCIYRRDLLFREDPRAETDSEMEKLDVGDTISHSREDGGWDNVVEDLQGDEGFEDYDDCDVFVQDCS